MADIAQIPSLPQTVALEGSSIEGDPLEFMRAKAKENIEAVVNHPIAKESDKIAFKKYILENLEEKIKIFKEIDDKAAAKKAEEEAKNKAEGGESKEEDPFADIFKDDEPEQDEAMQEKTKIAGEFALSIKNYREKYLKDLIRANESHSKKQDEAQLDNILGKLSDI